MTNAVSRCCFAALQVQGGGEGTMYHVCTKCRQPTDPASEVEASTDATRYNMDSLRPVPTQYDIDTSVRSADAIEKSGGKAHYRRMILAFIKERGARGATCDEVETGLTLRHQTASCFIRFLTQDGFLRATEMRRRTRAGRSAIVREAVPDGEL